MKKHILKISVCPIALLSLVMAGNTALASEVTGTLNTGLSGTNGSTVTGVVIAPPAASPGAGSYTSAQNVGLTADGASNIYYTIDGTSPACPTTGILYSSPISVTSSLVINAVSCYPESKSSTVATYTYAINVPTGSNISSSGGGGGSYSSGGSSGGYSPITGKADANGDGKVDISDFVILMANWGKPGSGNPADFSGDATIGIQDFVLLMASWTK
jgi:hypothetical protein